MTSTASSVAGISRTGRLGFSRESGEAQDERAASVALAFLLTLRTVLAQNLGALYRSLQSPLNALEDELNYAACGGPGLRRETDALYERLLSSAASTAGEAEERSAPVGAGSESRGDNELTARLLRGASDVREAAGQLDEARATVKLLSERAAELTRARDGWRETAEGFERDARDAEAGKARLAEALAASERALQQESMRLAASRAVEQVSQRIGVEKTRRLTLAKAALAAAVEDDSFLALGSAAQRELTEARAELCKPFTKDEAPSTDAGTWLNPTLTVTLPDAGPRAAKTTSTTLRAFLDANVDDEHACAAVRALKQGESCNLGGGATPLIRVTREN